LVIEASGKIDLKENDFTKLQEASLRSFKKDILLDGDLFSSSSKIDVWAEGDITFKGVSVNSGESSGNVTLKSDSKSVYANTSRNEFESLKSNNQLHTVPTALTTRKVFRATAVKFTAVNGDVVIHDTNFTKDEVTGNHTEFNATAKDHVAIYNSAIDHSKVAISANTVVLKDVQFHADSTVSLASRDGLVSGNPGLRTSVVLGNVNILSGVKYGDHKIEFDNGGIHMDQAAFRSAWREKNSVPQATADKISITKN